MNNCQKRNEGSMILVVVVAVVVLGVGALVLTKGNLPGLQSQQTISSSGQSDSPTNLEISGELVPGSVVELVLEKKEEKSATLESVKLENEGYVHVYKGGHGMQEKVLLGKSELLTVGTHSGVVINLSPAAQAGDVIVIGIYDASGNLMY